jgi:metal-dependent amidase/aminoacylase/carboxypeptidase family protein
LGTVLLTPKGVAARASCGLRFHIQGHSAHASEPEKGVSPGVVLGQLVQPNSPLALLPEQLLRDNHVPPQIAQGKLLATVVHFQLGEHSDFGILPANGSINVTCRADRTEDLRVLKEAVRAVVAQESKRGGCELIGME